jgi:multiple sugar transport system substrate-binding protein
MFGGNWFDEAHSRVIAAEDPRIVAAYAWQGSWVAGAQPGEPEPYALDKEVAQAFYNGFQAGGAYFSATNPFYTGKVAMITEGEWQCTFIPKYAPDLEWGVAPIPQPEGVPPRAYSPSVVLDAIPIGSRRVEEAFTFLRWYYSPRSDGRPSPASDYCYNIHNIPTRKGEASQDRFINNPKFKMFVDEMLTKEAIYFPPVPVGRFFQDQVNVAREYVIFGEKTPAQALRELQLKTNDEWRRIAGPAEEGGT